MDPSGEVTNPPTPATDDEATERVRVVWRGDFVNQEVNVLHAVAFGTRVYGDDEWDWLSLTRRHSLGWVTARSGADLVGFANVLWDGLVHAWIQDVMVSPSYRRRGIGTAVVHAARDGAAATGCEWLHVDFEPELSPFYIERCGFEPAQAGTMRLD